MKKWKKHLEKSFFSEFKLNVLIIWVILLNIPALFELIYFVFNGKFTTIRIGIIGTLIWSIALMLYLISLLTFKNIQKVSFKENTAIHSVRKKIIFMLLLTFILTLLSMWDLKREYNTQKDFEKVKSLLTK